MKKLSNSTMIGDQGIALIHTIVADMGFAWNPISLDAGIDGIIELRDVATERATNCIIQVQSKATDTGWENETDTSFQFRCEDRDISYWLAGNAPVILVCSRPRTKEAYWVSIKEYFQDLSARKSRKVVFNKAQNRFDHDAREALERLGMPADSGLYLGTKPKPEYIHSNLLETLSLESYWVAQTDLRTRGQVFARLRELTGGSGVKGEWILHNGTIRCFHNLADWPWNRICDRGTIDELSTSDWAETTDPNEQRLFVQILNACLREKLFHKRVKYFKDGDYYYFRAPRDMEDWEYFYQSREQRTSRFVFKGYPKKSDPSAISYYRHSAFEGHFIRFGRTWFLQVTPTYHYTRDGERLSRFSGDLTSGVKRLENNQAVHGQVVMWSAILTEERGLFDSEPIIQFDPAASFDIEVGIDDESWLKREEPEKQKALEADDGAQGRLAL